MAELTTRLIAQLVDKVSGPARAASQSMQSFYRAAGDGTGLARVNERMAFQKKPTRSRSRPSTRSFQNFCKAIRR